MAETESRVTDTRVAATPPAGGAPPAAGGAGLSARQVQMRSLIQAAGMLPVLIILCIAFHYLSGGRFFTPQNISIVAQQASINTVLASGMTFVILTGGIDLSVGSILAVSAMMALIASLIPGWGMLGLLAGLLTGLVFGLANGALIAFAALPPFIVTLGSLTAVRGIARLLGSDATIFNPDLPFDFIGNGSLSLGPVSVPWLVVIAVLIVVISWYILRRTVLGVRIYAVGGNPAAARLSGIKVWLVLLFVYAVSGLLAGLGGVMSAARLFAANGLQLGQSYELDAIAAVILGGTSFVGGIGSIWGTLVGAFIIAALTNGLVLVGVSDIWQFIIKGLVIIGAVALDRFRLKGGART
jgi:ribose transport system permease protein